MDFLSLEFAAFLCVAAVLNYVLPKHLRGGGLLLCSLYFYYFGAKQYVLLVAAICLITYFFGCLIEKHKNPFLYALAVCAVLVPLLYFKYFEFALDLVKRFLELQGNISFADLIAPLGISFMSFQAVSYLGDVYYGKIVAEKNPIPVALQVCFFPNVTSGPIQKAKNFIPQIKEKAVFEYELVKHGLLLIVYGGLQKFYISDKLAPMISSMQSDLLQSNGHGGFHYLFFAVAYAIYIYSNFNSYSDIATGIAEVLGVRFTENFKRPYLSQSVKEFWQRWHISLNSWFVDYVYIPLGGSRKGKLRYYLNIAVVFFLSGLWHGASLHFIAWGLLNAVYQIVGNLTCGIREKIYQKLRIDPKSGIIVFWKRCCVFYLIAISWLFFAIPGTTTAAKMTLSMAFPSVLTLFDGWIFNQFESVMAVITLLATIFAFAFVQVKRERMSVSKVIGEAPVIIRYGIYAVAVAMLLFGFFGTFTGAGNGGFVYGDF